jgi:hypothetical protein
VNSFGVRKANAPASWAFWRHTVSAEPACEWACGKAPHTTGAQAQGVKAPCSNAPSMGTAAGDEWVRGAENGEAMHAARSEAVSATDTVQPGLENRVQSIVVMMNREDIAGISVMRALSWAPSAMGANDAWSASGLQAWL